MQKCCYLVLDCRVVNSTIQLEWKWCLIFLFWTTKTLVWRISQGSYLVKIVHWEHRMHCLYTITSRLLIFVYLILQILQFSKTNIESFVKIENEIMLNPSRMSKERKVPNGSNNEFIITITKTFGKNILSRRNCSKTLIIMPWYHILLYNFRNLLV